MEVKASPIKSGTCPMHSFDVSISEAREIQHTLRELVELTDTVLTGEADLIGGADVAFLKRNPGYSDTPARNRKKADSSLVSNGGKYPENQETEVLALAVIVTIGIPSGNIVETVYATAPVIFPYVPGFLSFREGPAVLAALTELNTRPGVMVYDGCGIAHPRRFGLASHMAVLTGIPSIGCAKSLLCGTCDMPLPGKGTWTELYYHDELVGVCLRTRERVKPVYISPGSGFSVDGAREMVMSLVGKYRLPEPTRLAHNFVTAKKKELIHQSG